MPTVNEELHIGSIEGILSRYPEYHQINLVCSLEDAELYKIKKTNKIESFGNILNLPSISYEYEIQISGSAFNCFGDCPVNIFLTFQQDELAWEKLQKSIANVINNRRAVMVIADVYNIQDGEFSLFNPVITPTNCHARNT
jgi:hypothetical protein